MAIPETNIQTTSVMADIKKPFMTVTNRWAYLEKHLPIWKSYIRYRMYAAGFGLVGILTIFSIPPLGVLCLAAATYYWQNHLLMKGRLTSARSVIIGH
jgi:hypothetical protein